MGKQYDYLHEKIYETQSMNRNQQIYHNQNECKRKTNDIIKEQDRFNIKLYKLEKNQQNICLLTPSELKSVNLGLEQLRKSVDQLKVAQESCPLNSSLAESEDDQKDVSTMSEIISQQNMTPPNDDFNKKDELTHPTHENGIYQKES